MTGEESPNDLPRKGHVNEAEVPFVHMAPSLSGRILVARPELHDPNFDATLTLILEHSDEGALGLVLNRPSRLTMADAFPDWEEMAADPDVVFAGGPVDRDALIALGRSEQCDGALVLGAHSVDLDAQPTLVAAEGVTEVRVFAGYAGWAAGQLEGEIANEGWWVVDATIDDLFTDEPGRLWAKVLRRQRGELRPLRWYAHFPLDPSLN
jgi:putative transcriptional regulator